MRVSWKLLIGLILLVLVFVFLLLSQEKQSQRVEDLVSLIEERSNLKIQLPDLGWEWKEQDVKGTQDKGEITFSDTKWLMYLIHWGPIQVPEVTINYVKERMQKMWGVDFEFTGMEGRTTIAAHPAVWVEAYGPNRAFFTRFIIWNCPQSGREFIADTNYNLKMKTPDKDFEAETRSAKTIQCHQGALVESYPELTKQFTSDRYKLTFSYPEEWFFFDSPYYVPFPHYEGMRDKDYGSLLGLCSDQNIEITLKWYPLDSPAEKKTVMGVNQEVLDSLTKEIESQKQIMSIYNHGFEHFQVNHKKIYKIWGKCTFREVEKEKSFFTEKGIYQVAQWDLPEKGKKAVLIMITRQYKYGSAFSSPSRHFHDPLLLDFIWRIK